MTCNWVYLNRRVHREHVLKNFVFNFRSHDRKTKAMKLVSCICLCVYLFQIQDHSKATCAVLIFSSRCVTQTCHFPSDKIVFLIWKRTMLSSWVFGCVLVVSPGCPTVYSQSNYSRLSASQCPRVTTPNESVDESRLFYWVLSFQRTEDRKRHK